MGDWSAKSSAIRATAATEKRGEVGIFYNTGANRARQLSASQLSAGADDVILRTGVQFLAVIRDLPVLEFDISYVQLAHVLPFIRGQTKAFLKIDYDGHRK